MRYQVIYVSQDLIDIKHCQQWTFSTKKKKPALITEHLTLSNPSTIRIHHYSITK